jgi:hypothetical protein
MNRYSVKYKSLEMASFVRRDDAIKYITEFSREHKLLCVLIDNGGKFLAIPYFNGHECNGIEI